jgi:hypothetical protein
LLTLRACMHISRRPHRESNAAATLMRGKLSGKNPAQLRLRSNVTFPTRFLWQAASRPAPATSARFGRLTANP